MDPTELVKEARDAKTAGYQAHSDYAVGAALLVEDGTIYKGSNIETATYDMCIHAERSAIDGALTDGVDPDEFVEMAISTQTENGEPPCGTCRQFIAEFCDDDFVMYSDAGDGTEVALNTYVLGDIFPHAFRPDL